MDERRFDELTKALVAAKPSRREALRRLAGGALAAVFGGVALEGASAQRVGIEARTCGQNCNVDGDDCNAGLRCGAGSTDCVAIVSSKTNCNGNDGCPEKYETCNNNGKCVNTVANCNECFDKDDCEGGRVCNNGKCIEPDCTENSDCGKNKRCRKGECVRKN